MWGVLEKVVEDSWSYKRSYLWCFGNPACVNSTGSNRTGKDQVRMSLGLLFCGSPKSPLFFYK